LPKYVAVFRVAPEVFPRLRFAGRFARVGEVADTDLDGWLRVSVGFDVEEMACEYALGFGSKLEVIEPRSLREKVIAAAQEVVKFYQPRTDTDDTD
jgi:predicted DNA-binding transcriptional regulator YafY